jgi:cell division protein FtsA
MAQGNIIGAVEMGTSKIVVLVGEFTGDRSLNIIGMGQSTSMGIKKGEIVDWRAVSDCTHAALSAAEQNSGTRIDTIFLSCTGGHLNGFTGTGSLQVSSSDNIVSYADLNRVIENAKSRALPKGRVYIHHIRSGFLLDGREVKSPLQMRGEHLDVNYWHVHGDEKKISDQIHIINGYGLEVRDMVVSSMATGSILATDEEKQSGVMIIDIGCGTTDYVLYQRGAVQRTGVIAVGGDHITNDLAIGLRVNYKNAENIKVRHGKAVIDSVDKQESVMMIGDMSIGDRSIPRLAIYKIIHSRMEEIFMILKNKLGSQISPQNIPAGIILTGGTSRMLGICELAHHILGVEARQGKNPLWARHAELKEPEYSCPLGLLYYGLTSGHVDDLPRQRGTSLLTRVAGIFTGKF